MMPFILMEVLDDLQFSPEMVMILEHTFLLLTVSKRTLKKIMIILLSGTRVTLVSKFLYLRYSVKNSSRFWPAFFSRRRFLRVAACIPEVIHGLLLPQLEIFLVWMGKCSLKTVSNVL